MGIDIKINTFINYLGIEYCPRCLGTRKLKAMQSVTTFNGESFRGEDIIVKCKHCDGRGLITKHKES